MEERNESGGKCDSKSSLPSPYPQLYVPRTPSCGCLYYVKSAARDRPWYCAKSGTGNPELRTRVDEADGGTHARGMGIPFGSTEAFLDVGLIDLPALRASYSPPESLCVFLYLRTHSTSTSTTCASLPGAQGARTPQASHHALAQNHIHVDTQCARYNSTRVRAARSYPPDAAERRRKRRR
jgi:hypothetical protein